MRMVGLLLILALSSGCSGVEILKYTPAEEIKPFHPPLPAPIVPFVPEPVVVTPERAKTWLAKIAEGEMEYFVIYGFNAQDWLSYGGYDQRKDYYIRQLLEIIKWYGHPSLNKEKADDNSEEGG